MFRFDPSSFFTSSFFQLLQLFLKLLVRRFDESISCTEQRIRTFFYAIKIRDRIL